MAKRGRQPNISFFAFTATPKYKTLEVFGEPGADGKPQPFHLYSMRQAIEEGFILDVLANYTTYKTYYRLIKSIEDDPEVDKRKAARALARFMSLHPHNIAQKTEVMVEHFRQFTMHKIGGKAKAMVVTSSRLHAVRYKQAFDRYIAEKSYQGIKTLVAFSGTVIDPDAPGVEYTEVGMNQGIREKELPERFGSEEYQVLLVAEKYQTGFDQPLLHTMYVDKRLAGIQAVQTLSRLNRTCSGKEDTFVLDFVNEPEEILAAFQPYYEQTLIGERAEPSQLYEIQAKLDGHQVYHKSEVEEFCKIFYKPKQNQTPADHARMNACIDPAVSRFSQLSEDEREEFRKTLVAYRNLYAFLSQVIPFQDSDLEKLYSYIRFLLTKLPRGDRGPVYDFDDEVALKYYRLQKISEGSIPLEAGKGGEVAGPIAVGSRAAHAAMIELSQLIDILNERFGTDFKPGDQLFLESIREDAVADPEIRQAALANTMENFGYVFLKALEGLFIDRMDQNEDITARFMNDQEFQEVVGSHLLEKVYKEVRNEQAQDALGAGEPFQRVEPNEAERFRTCVPLYTLKAAAGAFGEGKAVAPDGWVAPKTSRQLGEGMFVAQVVGRSMELRIPDGAWCLFRSPVVGTRQGRIVLVQHRSIQDPETGGSYTVKRYESKRRKRRHRKLAAYRDPALAGEPGLRSDHSERDPRRRASRHRGDGRGAYDLMTPSAQRQERALTGRRRKSSVEVLVSGGIDSAALLAFYLRQRFDVRALFVDFGQPAAKQESLAARAVCKHYDLRLSIITVESGAVFSAAEIPGRNAFLMFAAVLVRGVNPGIIAIGIHEGPPYYDCTEGFLKSIQTVSDGYAAGQIKVAAPFLKWSKQTIWEFCSKVGVPVDLTYSCERGGVRPCGRCLSCKDRRPSVLCRTSKLIHPASGASLETPLLVPSFSSKAFGFGRDGKSEVIQVLEAAQEFITRTCLVSAYDVHYTYIPEPQDLSITVDLMFLDSGGYEVSDDLDLSAVEKPVHRPGNWDAAKLRAIWDRWPADLPTVLVSYDHSNHRRSVTEQLRGCQGSHAGKTLSSTFVSAKAAGQGGAQPGLCTSGTRWPGWRTRRVSNPWGDREGARQLPTGADGPYRQASASTRRCRAAHPNPRVRRARSSFSLSLFRRRR